MGNDNQRKIYERFDNNVSQVVVWAKAASIDAHINCLHLESFAIGLITMGVNEVTSFLVDLGVDLNDSLKLLKNDLASKVEKGAAIPSFSGVMPVSKEVLEMCKVSDEISTEMGSEFTGLIHLFLALLQESKPIKDIFEKEGLDAARLVSAIKGGDTITEPNRKPEGTNQRRNKKGSRSFLDQYCVSITEQARQNKLDPVIARETEIEEAITILCRRGKNNPILLGEPGVGKSAIVEGLSQRIISGAVPKQLMNCDVYSLSLSSLVAGTKYRGEFEERIQGLIKEIQDNTNCILFIDEIHTLIGAGASSGGALDASNILKPFLARNDLKCIGATTLEDFKKYFKKDGALIRRFQQIMVDEPTQEQTYKIMYGLKHKFEEYHNCIISDEAIDAVITMSYRYQPTKNFPDKAIDVLDTACAKYAWGKDGEKPVLVMSDIAKVISEQCQIPLEIIMWDDHERIKNIQNTLSSRVMGQDYAIKHICKILKNAYSGISNPDKPIGSFVFGGESGTGKTYMAKELASAIFGKDTSFVKLDMSEFSESHSTSKLIGSPPGYVGFEDTDVFTDKVKRKPYCIVLLDEVEKAHPDVMKVFLQVMSDGTMTDSHGSKINFKNVVLIMTGNFGMNDKSKGSLGFDSDNSKSIVDLEQKRLIDFFKERYGAEFVNRVDEFIPFMPLSDEALEKIADKGVKEICSRIKYHNCTLKFAPDVASQLVKMSKDEYGMNANILNRLIVKQVEPCVADALMSLDVNIMYGVTISVKDGEFIHTKRKSSSKVSK
ncbi:ATP-dependent Clp protease ATP-binding subunit [bacterium]|nr:MAG: ATP-dependent Clp protease ATP-binding subunit [bacterium]